MASFVVEVLSEQLIQELNLLIGIEGQVEWIEKELRLTQSLLEHVESKEQRSEVEDAWAEKVRKIFRDVEDTIDIFQSKSARHRRRGFLKRRFFAVNHWLDRFKLAMKVERIKFQIRTVSEERLSVLQEGPSSCRDRGPAQDDLSVEAITSNEALTQSHKINIHEASTAVVSIVNKINAMVNQNLLLQSTMTESVEHIRDDFRHLQSILNDLQQATETDERTQIWVKGIKEASDFAGRILESFAKQRERQLQKGKFFNIPFYVKKDLQLRKDMERINVRVQDLYNRKWLYGISEFKEREGPRPTSTVPILKRGRPFSPTVMINIVGKPYLLLLFGFSLFVPFLPIQALILSSMPVMKEGVQTAADQEESINGDLRLMHALITDVGGMKHLDNRVTVWLEQMKEILGSEQQEMTSIRNGRHLTFSKAIAQRKIAKKFQRMNNKLRGMSRRKWTYDIGKIEGERISFAEDRSQQHEESATHYAVENQDNRSLEEAQQGSSHLLEQKESIFDVIFNTSGQLNPLSFEELHEQVGSIHRERDLMSALVKDAGSMGKLDARQTLWVEEIEKVDKKAEKFLKSYGESKGMGAFGRYGFAQLKAPKKIKKIKNRIHEISERKRTYDIGGIKERKGQSSAVDIGHKSSETAETSSHGRADRRHAFITTALCFLQNSIKLLYPRLANLVDQAEENAKSIRRELRRMDALLNDVGGTEIQDRKLKAWINDVQAVQAKAKETIADYNEKTKQQRWKFVLRERVTMAKKVKSIMKEIEDTHERKTRYGIEHIQTREELSTTITGPQQTTPSFFNIQRSNIIGFYDDVQAVLAQLLSNDEQHPIISIVGMEGIGKTFLAKLIYDAVEYHFPSRGWVNVEELLMGHREGEGKENVQEEEPPLMRPNDILTPNQCFIVLDDVRTTEIWDRLLGEFLSSNLKGSRIILTTRDVGVATHADPKSRPHKLKLLSDDDSWALFTQTPTTTIPPDEYSLAQRRKMVMRCGGLPASIVKLREQFSGVESPSAARSRELEENPNILDQEEPPWQKTAEMIKKGRLPSYLESCLLYLGRFPAEFDVPLRRLIVLWIAEGLVHQRRGDGDPPEEVAGRYLAELIDRNMVQVTKRKLNGEVNKCRLPYPLRELWLPKKAGPSSRTIRYLAYHYDPADASFDHIHGHVTNLSICSLLGYKHVVSIRSFDTREGSQPGKEFGEFLDQCISRRNFLSLRVLDLERIFRPELPKALGQLDVLRYLGLRWTYLQDLPSFITNLLNLQTLDLKHTSIRTLPVSIWKMEQLRHLYLDESYHCRLVPRPPRHSLTNLQTLWSVFIDENSPVKDGLDRSINLKRLGVASQLMSSSQPGAMLSQLNALANWVEKSKQLKSLRLRSFDRKGRPGYLPLKPLSGHTDLSSIYLQGKLRKQFVVSGLPWGLTDLTLSASGLKGDPMRTLQYLSNLRILQLYSKSFTGKNMLCSSRSFPQLRVLKLWKLEQLVEWKVKKGAMPNLTDIEIRSCTRLKMLPDGLRHLRTLQELKLTDMPEQFTDRIKDNQGEEWDKIAHVSFVYIDGSMVDHGKVAKASIVLRSHVWQKLLESAAIHERQKKFLSMLATEELLQRSTEACPFCRAELESAVHLFLLCKPIKMIWFAKWDIRTDYFSNLSILDWINLILTPSLLFGDSPLNETDFLCFAVILMEKTWLWRNKVLSQKTEFHPDMIYKETCSSFMDMLSESTGIVQSSM